MCLILEKDSVKTITHTDIVVYKLVAKVYRKIRQLFFNIQVKNIYRSPFYSFDYEKGVIYCGELRKSINPCSAGQTIEDGFHSYAHIEDAKRNNYFNGLVIVKCVIPAGAEFYKGHGIDGTPQYASNKIMIIEEV